MHYPINWLNDQAIRACFTYQTRFLHSPPVGLLPIGSYQRDQTDTHDNIVDRARHLGVEGQFDVVFTDGRLWAKTSGGRISLGTPDRFQRMRDRP